MINLLNLFSLGKLKYSASVASLLALVIFFLLPFYLNLAIFVLGLIFSLVILYKTKIKGDPKEIVVDEFLGMLVCLLIVNSGDLIINLFLFIAFRIIDLAKIPPFNYIDQSRKKSAILLDDLAIGISLGLIFLFVYSFF